MKKTRYFISLGVALLIIAPSGCGIAPALAEVPDEITVPLGPQFSKAEQQTNVLEQSLALIEDTYIHSNTGQIDLDLVSEEYQNEIEKGLTGTEFDVLMEQFTNQFPQGDIIYVTRQERIASDIAANTTGYGGIGAFVKFQAEAEPHVVILDVMDGSPAKEAGLKAHDSIYAVDGDPVRLEEGADVILRVRGEPGSNVVLTIRTPGKVEREVTLTREIINTTAKPTVAEIPGTNIGYILLPTVGSTTLTNDIVTAIENFSKNSETKGLVLDLRIAGSNSNFPLEDMLTLFLDGIEIKAYSLEESRSFAVQGQDFFGSQKIPLVVLVGENTSGATEVFAAAVQENGRGTVIGSRTTGSIESLTGFVLPNGGQLYVATTSFLVSGNKSLGIEGLNPEVPVEAGWDEIIIGQDPVIEQAVQILEDQK